MNHFPSLKHLSQIEEAKLCCGNKQAQGTQRFPIHATCPSQVIWKVRFSQGLRSQHFKLCQLSHQREKKALESCTLAVKCSTISSMVLIQPKGAQKVCRTDYIFGEWHLITQPQNIVSKYLKNSKDSSTNL